MTPNRFFNALILILFAGLFSLQSLGAAEIKLNAYGHIVCEGRAETLPSGDLVIPTEHGRARFSFQGECLPAKVSICAETGRTIFSRSYRSIINLRISQNQRYAAFFNGVSLVVLNLNNGEESNYPPSTIFALDNEGNPIYYRPEIGTIEYCRSSLPLQEEAMQCLFWGKRAFVFTAKEMLKFEDDRIFCVHQFDGRFCEAKAIDDILYIVEKSIYGNELRYSLYQCNDLKSFQLIDQTAFQQPDLLDTHEAIRAPLHYWETSFPSVVKNTYAQIQDWSTLYLHPGVDMFESPYTQVYSVHRGIVKAILTTGDEQYWRTAISNIDNPLEGYLYAHLGQNSFVYAVGDTVEAGAIIGTLFPAYSFSPHCHFARIRPAQAGIWNGNWWTVDNPLGDITNMTDSIPPVIENALGSYVFAFRAPTGNYLDPQNLSGQVKIIAKCCDYAAGIGFDYRIPIRDIGFKLYRATNPDSIVYQKFSFSLDMPLDTYFGNSNANLVLPTIYSRDQTCYSTNNNSARNFYFIITNSDGDNRIEPEDSLQTLDLNRFLPGQYLLEAIVRDASRNRTSRTMLINISNHSIAGPGCVPSANADAFKIEGIYPNPGNAVAALRFELPRASYVKFEAFDIDGRMVRAKHSQNTLPVQEVWYEAGIHQIAFDGSELPSGMYFYRLSAGNQQTWGKIVLIK